MSGSSALREQRRQDRGRDCARSTRWRKSGRAQELGAAATGEGPAIRLLPAACPGEIVCESLAQIVARHVAECVRPGKIEALLIASHEALSAASVVDPRRQPG